MLLPFLLLLLLPFLPFLILLLLLLFLISLSYLILLSHPLIFLSLLLLLVLSPGGAGMDSGLCQAGCISLFCAALGQDFWQSSSDLVMFARV